MPGEAKPLKAKKAKGKNFTDEDLAFKAKQKADAAAAKIYKAKMTKGKM